MEKSNTNSQLEEVIPDVINFRIRISRDPVYSLQRHLEYNGGFLREGIGDLISDPRRHTCNYF